MSSRSFRIDMHAKGSTPGARARRIGSHKSFRKANCALARAPGDGSAAYHSPHVHLIGPAPEASDEYLVVNRIARRSPRPG